MPDEQKTEQMMPNVEELQRKLSELEAEKAKILANKEEILEEKRKDRERMEQLAKQLQEKDTAAKDKMSEAEKLRAELENLSSTVKGLLDEKDKASRMAQEATKREQIARLVSGKAVAGSEDAVVRLLDSDAKIVDGVLVGTIDGAALSGEAYISKWFEKNPWAKRDTQRAGAGSGPGVGVSADDRKTLEAKLAEAKKSNNMALVLHYRKQIDAINAR